MTKAVCSVRHRIEEGGETLISNQDQTRASVSQVVAGS